MGITITTLECLLILAAVVALVARRLRLPYTVGLLLAGIGVALGPYQPNVTITKDLVFTLFLPPLVFEAAFALRCDALKRDVWPIAAMATLGVIASTAVIFAGLTWLLHWDWRPALMFSTLISATDPVSVIAMLKEAKVGGRFRLLIEAESLFNDGTAAALFVIALTAVSAGGIAPVTAVGSFLSIALGGIACGLAVGYGAIGLMSRTTDHLLEITCTVIAAFGSFLLAEHFGFSGVLAAGTAGIVLGNVGALGPLTAKGRDDAETFWEFAAFLANSLIFLLMGARLATKDYGPFIGTAVAALLLVLAGRAVAVYGTMGFYSNSKYRLRIRSQHLLVWGGMRGALALALALGLPASLPSRAEVVTVTFAIVAFSTVVQGITMRPALRRLLPKEDADDGPNAPGCTPFSESEHPSETGP